MCGIAGFMQCESGSSDREQRLGMAHAMAEALRHRGPDDGGMWDEAGGVTFANRRLAILDLTPHGHQPMASPDGRYVMTYNGEVYNFVELGHELEALGFSFRGHSDTEVMLAAFQAWGIEASVKRFIGMFAFAVWDRSERLLFLARDRLGIKPLYYGWYRGVFLFGSELKALRAYPGFNADIDREALCLYLRHNYIPSPRSIYKGIYKLLPGRILSLPCGARDAQTAQESVYWSLRAVAESGQHQRLHSDNEALEMLEATLRQAVACRMIADVPLGVFLSGGIDSSTIVALMQAHSRRPVQSFSIGFREPTHDEAVHARRVAAYLGTQHTELYVTPEEAMAIIPALPAMFDEPFADSSQIPTFLVAQLARRAVTVSLSGDGGDELFAGYDRYSRALELWRKMGHLPRRVRQLAGSLLTRMPTSLSEIAGTMLRPLAGGNAGELSADRLKKLGVMLASKSQAAFYRELLGHWPDPAAIVLGGRMPEYFLSEDAHWAFSPEPVENMCFADLHAYLPDDILTKLDRTSMAVSLEARVPFLDHRVVELSWRIPVSMKLRDGVGKWPLRQVLYKYVPREIVERPKMGFGVPIEEWLRGPLREWADALLDPARLAREGFFDAQAIQRKWREHLSGRRRWHYLLWDVLMFQAWLECQ